MGCRIKEAKLNHDNFMEELPVVIKNSHLVNSVLCELQSMSPSTKRHSFLDLSTRFVLLFFVLFCSQFFCISM